MTHELPPQDVPKNNPRPPVDRLRKWPFVALGGLGVAVLAGVTIGPSFFRGEEQEAQAAPDMRINQPRGLHGLATDYSQVQQPETPEPEAKKEEERHEAGQQQQAQRGYSQPQGPSRAELIRAARMADLKPVTVSLETAEGEAGGGGGGRGSALYSSKGLTNPFPCQVNAGTNIPANMELRMTSESAGIATAVSSRDIWSADKKCLAMPRGTRFVGKYQTSVQEGQSRLGVLWTGLTRPPPRSDTIDLEETVAGEPDGTAGVKGEVNTHFWSKLGYVGAATILDLGKTVVTAGGEGGIGAAVAGIFADRASSPLDEWAKKKLNVPDVITTEPKSVSIVLAQHLPMDEFRKRRK